jgi:hypothetical protein
MDGRNKSGGHHDDGTLNGRNKSGGHHDDGTLITVKIACPEALKTT